MKQKIDINYIASLSKLQLNFDEKKEYRNELIEIMKFIDKINNIKIKTIKPIYHVNLINNVFRKDKLQKKIKKEKIFKVPRIL